MAGATKVCVGVFTGAHGVRGLVRLKSFTEDPAAIAAYGPLTDDRGRRFDIALKSSAKDHWLAAVEGVGDREAAQALAGTQLYADRDRLPPTADEDEFYHADLIGLAAELADGTPFGRVRAIHQFGGGDVIELGLAAGGALMLPFTKAAVPVIDIAGGRIVVDPPAEVSE